MNGSKAVVCSGGRISRRYPRRRGLRDCVFAEGALGIWVAGRPPDAVEKAGVDPAGILRRPPVKISLRRF